MDTQTQAERFKELADKSLLLTKNLAELDILRMLIEGFNDSTPASEVSKLLFTAIRSLIKSDSGIHQADLRKMESLLYQDHMWLKSDRLDHLIIEQILHGVNERFYVPLSDEREWVLAIAAAQLMRKGRTGPIWHGRYISENATRAAAARLRDKGYDIKLGNGHFYLEHEESRRLTEEIDWLTEQASGKHLISVLLDDLQRRNRFSGSRYQLGRTVRTLDWDIEPMPSYPYGYLINLAAKHLKSTPATPRVRQGTRLLEIARDVVALLELEDYSAYAFPFVEPDYLPEYVRKMLRGDFCLSYRQLDPSHCIFMLQELFRWVNETKMDAALGFGIPDVIKLAETVLRGVPVSSINKVSSLEDIRTASGIDRQTFNKMLPHFIHNPDNINSNYQTPFDSPSVNLISLPLVWQPGGKALILSPPLISIPFWEAAVKAVSSAFSGASKQIGDALEPMLENMFLARGIDVFARSRKYKNGEIDLAITTPEQIFLFECKKKALTKPTLGGDVVDGLIDICLTFMQAQCQLTSHEVYLLRDGRIDFSDGTVLEHKGRRIEKIAITLHDFGSLQDRMVSANLINNLASSQMNASTMTDYQAGKFEECNELLKKLDALLAQKQEVTNESQNKFHDSVFLGTPQVHYLLEHCQNIEDFAVALGHVKTVVNGSLDMYATFSQFHDLGSRAKTKL